MASREWMITKVSLSLVAIITIVSICVGASSIVVTMKGDITLNAKNQDKHIASDERKWINVDKDIDSLKEKDHILEISLKEQAIQFTYIRKELEALNIKMDNFEVR